MSTNSQSISTIKQTKCGTITPFVWDNMGHVTNTKTLPETVI